MARRKLIRYSLAALLALFTILAGMLGYARWRYNHKLALYQQLERDGVELAMAPADADWLDVLATGNSAIERPREAVIVIWTFGDGRYELGGAWLNLAQLKVAVAALKERALELGVSREQYSIRGLDALHGNNEDALGDLRAAMRELQIAPAPQYHEEHRTMIRPRA